jgi:hypothetical protein
MSKIFEEGGEYNIRHLGGDQYGFQISLPTDEDGMLARFCVKENCSPGYFKVKPGTGITEGHKKAFCPYCQRSAEPNQFATPEQVEFGKSIMLNEAQRGVQKMVREAFGLSHQKKRKISGGLISMEISLETEDPKPITRPIEEELRRNITCPSCGLEHSVFGLAFWCPDCGTDTFMKHVEAELEVIQKIILDVPERQKKLGARIAAKDLDNALEDIVSIFEAVLKIATRRRLESDGLQEKEWQKLQEKVIRNKFQNLDSANGLIQELFKTNLFEGLSDDEFSFLKTTFEKRHPITHNLGVIDHKYMRRISSGKLGKEIRVTGNELLVAIVTVTKIVGGFYNQAQKTS